MVEIKYRQGDIFHPEPTGKTILCNQVNCKGAMGAGFTKKVKEQFPDVESAYKRECLRIKAMREAQRDYRTGLGNVQFFPVPNNNLYIANLFAQNSYGTDKRQTDYDAFEVCLHSVKEFAEAFNTNVVIRIPYHIGCGIAGGEWDVIEGLIKKVFNESKNNYISVEIWSRFFKEEKS